MIGGLTGTVCIATVETSGKATCLVGAWPTVSNCWNGQDRQLFGGNTSSISFQAGSSMTAPLVAALRTIWAPRVWMLLVLAGLFTTGNWQLSFNQRGSLLSVYPRWTNKCIHNPYNFFWLRLYVHAPFEDRAREARAQTASGEAKKCYDNAMGIYHLDRGDFDMIRGLLVVWEVGAVFGKSVNLPTARCPHVPHVYDLGRKCPPKPRYHDAVRLLRGRSHRPGSHRGLPQLGHWLLHGQALPMLGPSQAGPCWIASLASREYAGAPHPHFTWYTWCGEMIFVDPPTVGQKSVTWSDSSSLIFSTSSSCLGRCHSTMAEAGDVWAAGTIDVAGGSEAPWAAFASWTWPRSVAGGPVSSSLEKQRPKLSTRKCWIWDGYVTLQQLFWYPSLVKKWGSESP